MSVNLLAGIWLLSCTIPRRCACILMSNTTSHDNHNKINLWVSFSFLYEYGAVLLTNLACSRHTGEYWPLVNFVRTGYCDISKALIKKIIYWDPATSARVKAKDS